MPNAFDLQSIEIPCPKCGHKTKQTVRWLKSNDKIACPCGTTINLDAREFRAEIAKAEKAVRDFGKAFR